MTLSAIIPCQATGMLTTAPPSFFFFNLFLPFLVAPYSRPEIEPVCFTVEAQSLNHWTTRDVPFCFLLESPQHFLLNAPFL